MPRFVLLNCPLPEREGISLVAPRQTVLRDFRPPMVARYTQYDGRGRVCQGH
jgi:hypothetical protein